VRRAKRIRQIRARLSAAPASPWYVYVTRKDERGIVFSVSNFDEEDVLRFRAQDADPAAVDLLTNAPGDIEFLIAEVERLKVPRWWRRVESPND
jgi:hypothetical protein